MHRLPELLKRKQEKCPSKSSAPHLLSTLRTRTNHSDLPLTGASEASSFHSLITCFIPEMSQYSCTNWLFNKSLKAPASKILSRPNLPGVKGTCPKTDIILFPLWKHQKFCWYFPITSDKQTPQPRNYSYLHDAPQPLWHHLSSSLKLP